MKIKKFEVYDKATEVKRLINGLIRYLHKNNF